MSKQGQNTKSDFQAKVKRLLGEVESEVISYGFFQSEMKDEFSKYDDEETTQAIAAFIQEQISFKNVDSYGGDEGEGEQYWSVYEFTDKKTNEKCYVKFDGWHQSYSGSEFDNWFFVEPKEKLVTVYE